MSNNENSKKSNKDKAKPHKVQNTKKKKTVANSKTNNNKNGNGVKPTAKKVTTKKVDSNKKEKKQSKHPKLMLVIKIFIILFLLVCVIGAGIVAGMIFGLFGNDFEITKDELKIAAANSVVVDKNEAIIANLSGDEKRKIINLEDMSDYLPKAYVAIEDERYYSHSGVDFKRTAGAIVKTIGGNSSYGGSTITQQLVKNITKDDEASGIEGIMRKVKEWAKAYQVERMVSKDQILELYLNILYIGGNNLHGVELGSEYYFNKSAKDLDLAECAFLAGINHMPNSYDPYNETDKEKKQEIIKNRTLTVLKKMKELGYIENEEEYNQAIAKVEAGLTFEKSDMGGGTIYSYHTDALINQVISQVMEEKGISEELARNYVYSSGLTIHSTIDMTVQTRLEEEYAKSKYVIKGTAKDANGTLKNEHSQSGMAVVDYKTGQVVGIAGGLGEKTSFGWNRATQMKKQTGSSMKSVAVVAPGLEEKVIQASTVYDDAATQFSGNYHPKNYNRFMGLINIRSFIETSQNIPAIKIMSELTPAKSIEYLKKMGITSLDETNDNVLSLAIGGQYNGVSPLEMAVAYGTIANDGVCITPTFYTKVTDSSANTVLTPNQEKTRAISEQNAYIAKSIIQEPVKGASGTAKYCAISRMDVAAKTGTTDDDYDRWLCGFTPYYSAATWFGYDNNETVYYSAGNPAGLIWSAVMSDIHKGLTGASFTKPAGLVESTVCKTTGCLAATGCNSTYVEIFTQDNMPQKCEGHGSQNLCTESGKIATQYCPSVKVNNYGASVPKERLKLWTAINGKSSSGSKVNETCDIHKKPEEKPKEEKNVTNTTPANTSNTSNTNTNKTNTNSSTGGNTNTGGGTGNTNTGGGTQDPGPGNTAVNTPVT